MTPSDVEMLGEALPRLPEACKRMEECLGNMPSSGGAEAVTGGGTGEWGPTVSIALALSHDDAWRDLDKVTTIEWANRTRGGITSAQARELVDIVNRWAPLEKHRRVIHANLQAAANDLLNRHDDHGNCTSCKQVPGAYGTPHARGLCKTCDRWLQRVLVYYDITDTLPRKRLVEIGEANGKVTDRDIHTVYHDCTRRDT